MRRLRTGFTTGAYAAATTLAAWRCLHGRRNGARIGLLFPDGRSRRINVDGWEQAGNMAQAWARKDAGDDVDITNGVVIRSRVRPIPVDAIEPEDHTVRCGDALLAVRGGPGVGLSTRPGLEVPAGKWAINPVPRQMVADNLERAGAGRTAETLLVEIEIEKGCELAKKTLNPMLGVANGLSVLGTSGIVIPCSNAAYIKTIEILLKGARRAGCDSAVLVTGGRTHRAAREAYPDLSEVAFIRIGDFIREACDVAVGAGFRKIVVCCMPGKLAKYALGHEYTHAHTVALSMAGVAAILKAAGLPETCLSRCVGARSVREFMMSLESRWSARVAEVLHKCALETLCGWAPATAMELRVLSFEGMAWLR